MPAEARRAALTALAALFAGCTPFHGVYRGHAMSAAPAGDCVLERLRSLPGIDAVEREGYRGDPLLTALGAVAPVGHGEVYTWTRDGAEVELWLLHRSPDGPRYWQIHAPESPGTTDTAAVSAQMQTVERELVNRCGLVTGVGPADTRCSDCN